MISDITAMIHSNGARTLLVRAAAVVDAIFEDTGCHGLRMSTKKTRSLVALRGRHSRNTLATMKRHLCELEQGDDQGSAQ
eukprot:4835866-Pyramimonas_sp.AAC.1